jgi:hypothetical protein
LVLAALGVAWVAQRTLRLRHDATAPLASGAAWPTPPAPSAPRVVETPLVDDPDVDLRDASSDAAERTWREPIDGACPAGHLVKVKEASGLYHAPGMAAYARTKADRCYASAEAAEADGFTRAKR